MIIKQVDICNPISQDSYDSEVDSIDRNSLRCNECNQVGFYINSYYERHFKVRGQFDKAPIIITQIICKHCGKTHAILLSSMIPWCQIGLHDMIDILYLDSPSLIRQFLSDFYLCLIEDIHRAKQKFIRHWKERLNAAGLSLTHDISPPCVLMYQLQFMQIRRTSCFGVP